MGFFSRFEGKMDDAVESVTGAVFKSPIEPAQIAKKAEKMMNREKLVGAGCQYAPTLYTILVNKNDDKRLFGFYPTMAAEIETYLIGRAEEAGLVFDCRPLVRFIAQDGFKSGKFDVVAENVAGPIIESLRQEEAEYYGLNNVDANNIPATPLPVQTPPLNTPPFDSFAPYQPPLQNPYGAEAYPQNIYATAAEEVDPFAAPLSDEPLPYEQNRIPQTVQFPGSTAHAMAGAGLPIEPLPVVPAAMPTPIIGAPAAAFPASAGMVGAGAVAGAATVFPATATAASSYAQAGNAAPSLLNLQDNRLVPLTAARLIIGRDSSSDIQLSDSNISRSHAEIFFNADGRWFIRDLGSTNGTKINGRRITEAPLNHGDIITMGVTRLEFREY